MQDDPAASIGEDKGGLILGAAAYACWGLLPVYFHHLSGVPAIEVAAYRAVCSTLLLGILIVSLRRFRALRAALDLRTAGTLAVTAACIGSNWLLFIWAVQRGDVLAASLGSFLMPLVNVALAVVVLGERLSPSRYAALAVSGAGVVVLGVGGAAGSLLTALALAILFGVYGVMRRLTRIDALGGLAVETAILAVPAAAFLLAGVVEAGHLPVRPSSTWLLLGFSGAITSVPLLMFVAAARRARFSTLAQLQYISPSLQFAEALIYGERLARIQLVTFGLVWIGCGVFAWDAWRSPKRERA